MPAAGERRLEQVVALHQHLGRQAAREHFGERLVLRRMQRGLLQADEDVGKLRARLGLEPVGAEVREQRVVARLAVRAFDFQRADRERARERRHLGQSAAERRQRRRAIAELEAVGLGRRVGQGEKALRAQHREHRFDAAPPRGRKGGFCRHRREQRGHALEVERLRMHRADRGAKLRRAAPRAGLRAVRAQDVLQPEDEAFGLGAERFSLRALHAAPGVAEKRARQRRVAVDDAPVAGDAAMQLLHALGERRVRQRREARRGAVDQRVQRAAGAAGDQGADLALDLEGVRAQARVAAGARCGGEHAIDEGGERFIGRVLRALEQDERKVVTQACQVAVGGERGRAQPQGIERLELLGRAAAGEEERDLRFARHVHRSRPALSLSARW